MEDRRHVECWELVTSCGLHDPQRHLYIRPHALVCGGTAVSVNSGHSDIGKGEEALEISLVKNELFPSLDPITNARPE